MSEENNSWPALRTISGIFRIFAYIAGGLGGLGALVTLFTGQGFFGKVGGFFIFLFIAAIQALFLVAVSEGIKVGLAVEENTRKSAEAVNKLPKA